MRLSEHVGEAIGVDVALVERDARFAGDGGGDAGRVLYAAGGADAAEGIAADLADFHGEAGSGDECVVTQRHGRGAGVGGLAGERERVPFDAEAADDRTEGEAGGFEDRALFDVHFEVRARVLDAAAGLFAVGSFLGSNDVSWGHAAIMAVAAVFGSFAGAGVARRLPAPFVRRGVALIGFALAAYYFWPS